MLPVLLCVTLTYTLLALLYSLQFKPSVPPKNILSDIWGGWLSSMKLDAG